MSNLITYSGLLLLAYAAYSAAQSSSINIPPRVIIQALFGMLVTMAGLVRNIKLMDIKYTGHKNYDTIVNRPNFYTFNHRGRFIYSHVNSS